MPKTSEARLAPDQGSDGSNLRQNHLHRAAAVAAVLALSFAGCGSRLTHARLEAEAIKTAGGIAATSSTGDSSGIAGGPAPVDTTGSASAGQQVGAGASQSTGTGFSSGSGIGGAGSSRSSSSPGGRACTSPGTPITIGTVGEQTGVVGAAVANGPRAVQAWAASVNASGGLNCHRVKYVVDDDGGDPSRNQALTQQLVEQFHVIALVHLDAVIAGQASVSYLTQKQVPAIGSETGSDWFYSSPMYFPQTTAGGTTLLAAYGGVIAQAKPTGLSKMAIIACVEVPICTLGYDDAPQAASSFKVTLAYRGRVSLAQPDFTAVCQAMQAAGAQFVVGIIDANSYSRLARSCSTVNYHPVYGTGGPIVTNAVFQDPALDGMLVGASVILPSVTTNAQVAAFLAALKQYAPGVPADGAAMTGWVSAKLFETAANHLSSEPTSKDILSGLWSINGVDLGGMTLPLTFKEGQNAPRVLCYYQGYVKQGQLLSPNSGQRTCV